MSHEHTHPLPAEVAGVAPHRRRLSLNPTFNNEDAAGPDFEKLRWPDDGQVCPYCRGVVEVERKVMIRCVDRARSRSLRNACRIAASVLETLGWIIAIYLVVYLVWTLDPPQ
jgi:hypothetical protein